MTQPDVPTLSLPREDLMRLAFALRTTSRTLAAIRARRGRVAWEDARHAERREKVQRQNDLRPFDADVESRWRDQFESSGRTDYTDDGRWVRTLRIEDEGEVAVQVGADDDVHAQAVVGSEEMARRLFGWWNADTADADEMRSTLADRQARSATPPNAPTPPGELARRVTGIPGANSGNPLDRTFDHPSWHVAERQFRDLVRNGHDPDGLVAVVAAIDFDRGDIRSPGGFAAWAMRESAKRTNGATVAGTEDQARREVAEEWLEQATTTSPFDRARASWLLGEFDESFDAKLNEKYPGLLHTSAVEVEHEPEGLPSDSSADEPTVTTATQPVEHEQDDPIRAARGPLTPPSERSGDSSGHHRPRSARRDLSGHEYAETQTQVHRRSR